MRQANTPKSLLLFSVGICFSVIPVIIAVLSYFPLWLKKGGSYAVSGIALFLLLLSLLPLYKVIKRILRSPASYTLWFILFVLFFLLSKIADEMTVISFVGFVSNCIGAIFFKLSKKYKRVTE